MPMSRNKAMTASAELIRARRPTYTTSEIGWLIEPLAEVLRAGVDPEVAWALVNAAELAGDALRSRRAIEQESAAIARRIAEGS